jgi:hypothetical protein
MRRFALVVLIPIAVAIAGCSYLTRGNDEGTPEKLYADTPCPTECCCKTTRGYYAYFRCEERGACEREGGSCERPDLARCGGEGG